jgi:hypothetical protein
MITEELQLGSLCSLSCKIRCLVSQIITVAQSVVVGAWGIVDYHDVVVQDGDHGCYHFFLCVFEYDSTRRRRMLMLSGTPSKAHRRARRRRRRRRVSSQLRRVPNKPRTPRRCQSLLAGALNNTASSLSGRSPRRTLLLLQRPAPFWESWVRNSHSLPVHYRMQILKSRQQTMMHFSLPSKQLAPRSFGTNCLCPAASSMMKLKMTPTRRHSQH